MLLRGRVQIGQYSVEGSGGVLSQPAGQCVRALRVTVQDDYGLCIVLGTQRLSRWLRCICAGQERSPETCIIAAFAAHQWTSAVLDGRCI